MSWDLPETRMPLLRHLWRIPAIALILTSFAILATIYSIVTPVFEAPDELQHFAYVAHLAEGRGVPPQGDPQALWAQEASQPPLYHALVALVIAPTDTSDLSSLVWLNSQASIGDPLRPGNKNRIIHTQQEMWPYWGTVLAVHLARLVSIILGLGTVFLVYAIGRRLLPGAPGIALAASAFTAFTPQFIFINSVVSNDSMITFTSALTAWLLLQGLQKPRPRAWPVLLGLALGLATLSKLSALALWALVAATMLWDGLRQRKLCFAVVDVTITFVVAGTLSGWWYARNLLLYGDATGLNTILGLMGQYAEPCSWDSFVGQFRGLRISYWALFGWFNVPFPPWVYRTLDGFVLLALGGLVWLRRRKPGPPGWHVAPEDLGRLAIPVLWTVLILASLLRYNMLLPALQGRLLFPAAWAINLLFVLGWSRWTTFWSTHRFVALWTALPVVFLASMALSAPWAVIRPAYAASPLLTANEIPAEASVTPLNFAGIARVVGYELPLKTVRPGERLPVTAYWEVLGPTERDPMIYVHLLGRDRRVVGQIDTYLGLGAYPFALLKPGDVVKDTYLVPVEAAADAPTLLRVDVGLFDRRDPVGPGFPPTDAAGQPADSIIAAARLLPTRTAVYTVEQPASFDLGGQVKLLGYALSATTARPGETVILTLYWQPQARLAEDFQVFVHLTNAGGETLAQGDKAPLDGDWPATAWEPGLAFRDEYPILLPADMPAGVYDLLVGLYRLTDGWRLPVTGATGPLSDAAATLAKVEVR